MKLVTLIFVALCAVMVDANREWGNWHRGWSHSRYNSWFGSWRKLRFLDPIRQSHNPGDFGKHVGAYFPNYSEDLFPLSSLDMSLYSDVYYFVTVTTQTSAIGADLDPNDVKNFVARANAGGTRPILSIGGWTGSVYFSSNVATPANRTAFAQSIAQVYRKFRFQGIDIDWEYPSSQGIGCNTISTDDTNNLISFLQELRGLLPHAVFSMAASMMGITTGDGEVATDLTALAKVIDVVNIMDYDAWGSWSDTTGPLAPFSDACAGDGVSVQKSIQIFLDQQFSPSQLVMGIPAYGSSWTTLSSTLSETTLDGKTSLIYQQKSDTTPLGGITDDPNPGPDVCGNPQGPGGTWLVSELVKDGKLSQDLTTGGQGYTRYWDDCSSTPFLFNNATRNFIAYDDIRSTVNKAKYAKALGLKGIFFFDTTGALPDVVHAATRAL